MKIEERELSDELISVLIELSVLWEKEDSCYGYRKNNLADIEGNRVFVSIDQKEIVGYLFGHIVTAETEASLYHCGDSWFEIEELYVKPQYRCKGIGRALFQYAENAVKQETKLILLSTATKNYKSILHFYLDELGMEFWSARLFKKIGDPT